MFLIYTLSTAVVLVGRLLEEAVAPLRSLTVQLAPLSSAEGPTVEVL